MSTAIAPYINANLEEKRAYVQTLAQAGELLPKGLWANTKNPNTGLMENKPSPGKIMLIMETGLMLGLHPMAAFGGIDVIEGKPTLKPSLMSALIRTAGHSLRILESGSIADGDIAVTTTIIRSDDPDFAYVYTWTPEDALRAGLIDSYAPDAATGKWVLKARSKDGKVLPWEAYTKRLLRWRSLSDAASAGAEDVLFGMHYTAEELGATVDERGDVMDTPAEETPAENWTALIDASTTADEITVVLERAEAAGQRTDAVLTLALTRRGMLSRAAANIVDAEVVPDDEPTAAAPEAAAATEPDEEESELAKYERESAEEYAAEMKLTGA